MLLILWHFVLLIRVTQNSTQLSLYNYISMTQLRCLFLWLDTDSVSIYLPEMSFEINIPLRWFVKFTSLILKCHVSLIQSQSRGDNVYMDAGTSSPFPVTAYYNKHLRGLKVKHQGWVLKFCTMMAFASTDSLNSWYLFLAMWIARNNAEIKYANLF